ncbi:MAG: C-factor [Burkholderiales bacterium PBB3]|nr:MAG: C-factor [Burkholderiales bacterium PBB3]
MTLNSLPPDCLALVIGATGGIGQALVQALHTALPQAEVLALSRRSQPALDLQNEASLSDAAAYIRQHCQDTGRPLRLVINATGTLHTPHPPEKSWAQLDAVAMAQVFAVNTVGPALLMKHLLPLLPRQGKAVFATLSAKVGSIGDNRLGGWYSYRASKAALNQLVRTAAIELRRRHPEALCVALHPGTVDTDLSTPFAKTGLDVVSPAHAATRLLQVIDGLAASDSGGFFNHDGTALPW